MDGSESIDTTSQFEKRRRLRVDTTNNSIREISVANSTTTTNLMLRGVVGSEQ